MPTLELRLAELDPFSQLCWVVLAEEFAGFCISEIVLLVDPSGLDSRLREFLRSHRANFRVDRQSEAGAQGAQGAVATVSSACNLLPSLLGKVDHLIVEAAERPEQLEPGFYWNRHVTGRFSAALEQAAVKVLGPDVKKELAEYLASVSVLTYRASLISSVFDADRFLDSFLENMRQLKGYDACQHFLINPGSPGNEHERLLDHARQNRGVVYIKLAEDPGLYETWNMTVTVAAGRYLSNANVDDRRHREHVRVLADLLDEHPQADVASSALRVTEIPNQRWKESTDCPVWYGGEGEECYGVERLIERHRGGKLVARNFPHCMPLWRRAVHMQWGFFNEEQYGPSADWEMWLRCGVGGAGFCRTGRALGLYLRHENSYWRRDAGARRFDERIKARYGVLAPLGEDGAYSSGLHSLPWRDLHRFRGAGSWLGVLWCLYRLRELPTGEHRSGDRIEELVERIAQHDLAIDTLPKERLVGKRLGTVGRLAITVDRSIRALHAAKLGGGQEGVRTSAFTRWQLLLTELYCLGAGVVPLIGLAWLQGQLGEPAAEAAILRTAHDIDGRAFWRCVQRVYRFSLPLDELTRMVGALRVDSEDPIAVRPGRLVYFPRYSNKYQDLLYWQASRAGVDVSGVRELDELAKLKPGAGGGEILHLHWLNAVFERRDHGFGESAAQFLAQVRKLKADGFQVYWTVHNRLNHDSTRPEAERQFRAELARLVDRVYLHHPLLRYELDWLPPSVPPWLCEHGPYVKPVPGGIGRETARKRLELDESAPVFLWFGQLRPYKALEQRLPAILEGLKSSPRARLIVAGKVQAREVRQMLLDAGEQSIFINRHVPNIELQHLADAADFGILTYRDILTSGAMIHMYCMGLPVIAPDLGAMAGYVVPEWNGFLYRVNDELKSFVERACAMPGDEVGRFARHATTTAESFRWGRVL